MTTPSIREDERVETILIVDRSDANAAWLREAIGDLCTVAREASSSKALAFLKDAPKAIVIVGETLTDGSGSSFLAALADEEIEVLDALYLADGSAQPPTDDVYFVLSREMTARDVGAVIKTALDRSQTSPAAATSAKEAAELARLLQVPRRFGAQQTLRGASKVATAAVVQFLDADRAACLFYDSDDGSLWTETDAPQQSLEATASSGLVGFAARTNEAICLERADSDPRYRPELDNPEGRASDRLLIQPLAGTDNKVHAVLVGTRTAKQSEFSSDDRRVSSWLATQLAPLTAQLAMKVEAELVLEEAESSSAVNQKIFRQQAADAYSTAGVTGDVVRVSPRWISSTYWMLVLLLAAGVIFASVTDISEYSNGPFVIQQSGRTDLSAPVSGNVVSIAVKPGDLVSRGQLLATFRSSEDSSQLERIDAEWQAALRRYLVNRSDLSARTAVSTLRSQREQLLDKLVLRATTSATVRDILVTSGQSIREGQSVLTLARPGGTLSVIAVLPGADLPLLREGMPLRAELDGYRDSQIELTIRSVSAEVIGPTEAALALGKQLGGALNISGPVVLVQAELSQKTFNSDDESYDLSHGMTGTVDVRLRSQNLIRALIPGFKR